MTQRTITRAFAIGSVLLLLAAPVTRAQDNCQSFRAILPMTFDVNTGWFGPMYGVMGTELLIGKWTTEVPPQSSCDAVSCQDSGGRVRVDLGGSGLMNPGDTLIIELQTAQYVLPDGYGVYHAMWKIVGGTGRFAQASGTSFESGPFVAWMDANNIPQGRYIGEVEGGICGVKPSKHAAAFAKPIPASAIPFYQRQFSPSGRK